MQNNINSQPAEGGPGKINVSLLTKILIASVITGLIPLLIISIVALRGYRSAATQAQTVAKDALDDKSLEALQLQTRAAAEAIEVLLHSAVQDTLMLSNQAIDPLVYETFYDNHYGNIEFPNVGDQPRRVRLPTYRELTFIDQLGNELFKIQDGKLLDEGDMVNVSRPENTTYKFEDYFAETIELERGEVYVSEVTAWHVYQSNQPGSLLNSSGYTPAIYEDYEAIIRFGTPVYAKSGQLQGMLLLSLDHRHIIEKMIHIDPASSNEIIWPLYETGNYAYIFDFEGYTIGHPLLNRIRGLDNNGRLLPYMQQEMSSDERARVPFNLAYADWADPNFPNIYDAILAGETGSVNTTNQGGVTKVTTYTPISFEYGVYAESGVFGGVAIGASLEDFHEAANVVGGLIGEEQSRMQTNLIWIGLLSAGLLIGSGMMISQTITRPIRKLTAVSEAMEDGVLKRVLLQEMIDSKVENEVSQLARVFLNMGEQIKLREENLREVVETLKVEVDEMKSLSELEASTDSDYFYRIEAKAAVARTRRRRKRQEREIA